MYSAKCEDGIYTVYCDGEVVKVLPNAFKFEQFMTVLWENQEIGRADIIDLMNPLLGYHPIREFDSRPTWYKLEDGKVWEQAWNGFEGATGTWKFKAEVETAKEYGEQTKNCATGE